MNTCALKAAANDSAIVVAGGTRAGRAAATHGAVAYVLA